MKTKMIMMYDSSEVRLKDRIRKITDSAYTIQPNGSRGYKALVEVPYTYQPEGENDGKSNTWRQRNDRSKGQQADNRDRSVQRLRPQQVG